MQTTLASIPAFYNTNATGMEQMLDEMRNAITQEQKVLAMFKYHHKLTPSQVSLKFPNWPITSVRRTITNLTSRGLLFKTSQTRKGPFNKNEYIWKIAV